MNVRKVMVLLFLLALAVRTVGLFRTVEGGASFHPDVPKQIRATQNYLHGQYIWYTGSLAYDGYPFGLNHVDEWIIRATWPVLRAGHQFLHPGPGWPAQPDLATVHTYCHVLRVAYGMAAWLLLAWALRRVGLPAGGRAAWLLLGALSPLLSTVTHFASGDVGTDLFVMLALAVLARARGAEPRAADFLLGGVALGLAFACKYQGVLGILAPGLFLLLAPLAWSTRFRLGLHLAAGSLIGFALLTPHLFIHFGTTLKNIGLNFRYIQRYGVEPEFFAQPLSERLSQSLHTNIPIAVGALGYGLLALAGVALLIALVRVVRQRTRESAWDAAVLVMPFAVLALALAGKPALQPFHFSLLPLPLLLGAACLWHHTRMSAWMRGLLGVLMVVTAGEFAWRQHNEWRFWTREEPRVVAERMREGLLDPPPASTGRSRMVAALAVEPANITVFRNAAAALRIPGSQEWTDFPQEAVPATPWSFSPDWMFLHVPTFPRESRLLAVEPGPVVQRLALDRGDEKDLLVTFQAGSREAEIEWIINGQSERQFLAPGQKVVLILDASRGTPFTRSNVNRRRHAVAFQAHGAPVLVRLGPEPVASTDPARLARKLARAHLLEGELILRTGSQPLAPRTVLLPGRYALEVTAPAEAPALSLQVDDALLPHQSHRLHLPLQWTQNVWRTEWDQPTQILFTDLSLQAERGAGLAVTWRVRPLAAHAHDAAEPTTPVWTPHVSFGRARWVLGNLEIPTTLHTGETLTVWPRLQTTSAAREHLTEYAAFLHVFDREGRQVRALDLPLMTIPSHRGGPALPQTLDLANLEPGVYDVRLGLYQPRTDQRLRPKPLAGQTVKGDRMVLGQFTLEP